VPTASEISLSETIELLDRRFANLATGVVQGQYSLWLGSGISRGRLDDLPRVVERALSFLGGRVDPADPACQYRMALDRALELASLSDADRLAIDTGLPVASWPDPPCTTAIRNLTQSYSRLLDIRVEGESPDFLLWDAVDVPATYADPAAEPDAEHLCLAVLILEGVVPEIATANWDGLIERAVRDLAGSEESLQVCVLADDFRAPQALTRLLKFHGCAVRASNDPATYRSKLIGQYTRITDWTVDPEAGVMRSNLVALAVARPTLMLGLSAQDVNIQWVFAQARAQMQWTWPADPPAHVFAEDRLGESQKDILKVVYREAYDATPTAIEQSALLRAFAKQALTALVLSVMTAKLAAFAVLGASRLDVAGKRGLEQGLQHLRDRVADAAGTDKLAFVRELILRWSSALSLFQLGDASSPGRYRPLTQAPVQRVATDPSLATSGIRELAAILGLLGHGDSGGIWQLELADPSRPETGAVRARVAGGDATRIFFCATGAAYTQLVTAGFVSQADSDAVVIHSTNPISVRRSPSSSPGRTGTPGLREVSASGLLGRSTDFGDLLLQFRQEASL
jgi:hypothetical protein